MSNNASQPGNGTDARFSQTPPASYSGAGQMVPGGYATPTPPLAPGAYPAPGGPAGGTRYGKIGAIIALIGIVVSLFHQPFNLLTQVSSVDEIVRNATAFTVIGLIISLAAFVFGIVGMRSDRDRFFAGVAVGIGGGVLVSLLVGWAINYVASELMY